MHVFLRFLILKKSKLVSKIDWIIIWVSKHFPIPAHGLSRCVDSPSTKFSIQYTHAEARASVQALSLDNWQCQRVCPSSPCVWSTALPAPFKSLPQMLLTPRVIFQLNDLFLPYSCRTVTQECKKGDSSGSCNSDPKWVNLLSRMQT